MQAIWFGSLGQEDPLEEEMATHSSILAWRIPWTEEPGGLQSHGVEKSWTGQKGLSAHAMIKWLHLSHFSFSNQASTMKLTFLYKSVKNTEGMPFVFRTLDPLGLSWPWKNRKREKIKAWHELQMLSFSLFGALWDNSGGTSLVVQWLKLQVGKIFWRRKWQSTPVFLPGESHGQRRLAGSWWDGKKLDTSKWPTLLLLV